MWKWITVVALSLAAAFGFRVLIPPLDEPAPIPIRSVDPDETTRLIEVFESRLADRSDYPDVLTLGGLYLDRAGVSGSPTDHARASELLERAVQMSPTDPLALESSAKAELALHDFATAARRAEQAHELDATRLDALAIRVDAALAVGDTETAALVLADLESRAGTDPSVLLRRSQLSWLTGDTDAALDLSQRAWSEAATRAIDPATLAVFEAHHARLLVDTGQYRQAIDHLGDTRHPISLLQLGRAQAALGDSANALATLESAAALRPDPSILAELGLLYAAEGAESEARAIDDTIRAIGVLDAAGAFDRTIARYLLDRNIDTERALELALADDRRDPGGHDLRAWAFHRSGAIADALAEIEQAEATGSEDPVIAFHAGVIRAAAGDAVGAVTALETALARSPGAPFAPEARELLEALSS
jgi:tetratricopeptide (TPR) repeat protein